MDRLERLRLLLVKRGFEAVLLCQSANIAAFFRGAQASLGFRQEPPGRVALCVTGDKVILLGNRTEVSRMADDELSWLSGLIVKQYRWDEWELRTSVKTYLDLEGIKQVGDDIGAFGQNIHGDLEAMYYPLSEAEVSCLRCLSKDAASIVESVARHIDSGWTEVQVAGELSQRLVAQAIWPEYIMVVADDRISRYRHCVPKDVPIRRMAFLSVTAHRYGLYVSLTRLVSLGVVTSEWRRFQGIANRIDAAAISLSKPGAGVGEIFQAIKRGYVQEGHPDEWTMHHQGGPAGFRGRDYKAREGEKRCLVERQPVVWNPTVGGAKSEDTILTTRSGQLPEILTDTGNWQYTDVNIGEGIIRRPAILEK